MGVTQKKVVLVWNHIGPYHIAWLDALGALGVYEVHAIQLANKQRTRNWDPCLPTTTFTMHTLEQGYLEDVGVPRLTKAGIMLLERLSPTVLVLAGYASPPIRAMTRWALRRKATCILMADTTACDRPRWKIVEWIKGMWVRRHFQGAFVSGEKAADYVRSLGLDSERIWKGLDVVDHEAFAKASERARHSVAEWEQRLGLKADYFLFVGRLAPEKNLPFLLGAYEAYRRAAGHDPLELVIVGVGPEEKHLKRIVQERKLDGVQFLGFQQMDMLPGIYSLARALLLPSLSETWGLSVNEAMACGVPVIISDRCGTANDLVRSEISGYIINPTKTAELARTMDRIGANPEEARRMGEAGRQRVSVLTPFQWAATLDRCIKICGRGDAEAIARS